MAIDDDSPPLVSSRSPSNARARHEQEHPSPTGDPQAVALLAQLSEAEENARRACTAVADRLADESLAEQVRDQAAAHQAHRAALGELIEALGGSPPRPDECREILVRGAEAVSRAESDADSMEALEVMRAELAAAYGEAMGNSSLDEAQRSALARLAP